MTSFKERSSVPLLYKILLIFFILLSLGLLIALVMVLRDNSKTEDTSSSSSISSCQSDLKQNLNPDGPPNVFQDLTKTEINNARDYILNQKSLNVTSYGVATLGDNFIFAIENYLPPKANVVEYLNGKTSQLSRFARVVLLNTAKTIPDIEEYIVGPLPNPTQHKRLLMTGFQNPIPYDGSGPNDKEEVYKFGLVYNVSVRAEKLLMESFEETMHQCDKRCLSYAPNGFPASFKKHVRQTWVQLLRDVGGKYLFTLPFEVKIDHSGADHTQFKVVMINYNNQLFSSVDELMEGYNNGSVKKIHLPYPNEEMLQRASIDFKKEMYPSKPLKAPKLSEPSGKRYSVHGNKVNYMNWAFEVSLRAVTGLGVFDIRYKGKRIVYELSLQEAFAAYSGDSGKSSSSYYADSIGGLGSFTHSLIEGVDCPETATYLDTYIYFLSNEPVKREKTICIFEYDMAMPIRRHREFKYDPNMRPWYYGGMPGKALMIRSVSTPMNYDYISDFIFHPNGVIETRTTATGYLQATYFNKEENTYGFQSFENNIGTIHDHLILYRVDLDIEGVKNSYQTIDVVPKNVTDYRWEPGTYRIAKTIEKNIKSNEKDAVLKYNFDRPKYMVMINEDEKNRFGNPKGYRIMPLYMVKQTFPDNFPVTRAAAWSKYQLAITKYNDNERYGICTYNQHGMEDPAYDFDAIINDNDNIQKEDLVAWVTVGGLHIPNTEDVPNTFTTGNTYTFLLKPYGYFDEDQSAFSRDSVYAEVDENGKMVRKDASDEGTCSI